MEGEGWGGEMETGRDKMEDRPGSDREQEKWQGGVGEEFR